MERLLRYCLSVALHMPPFLTMSLSCSNVRELYLHYS